MNTFLIILSIIMFIITAIVGHNFFYNEMKQFHDDLDKDSSKEQNKKNAR